MITGSQTVRTYSFRKRKSPLKLARVQRGRASIPLPWRESLTVASNHQLGANHQNLDIARINPGKSNSADQFVPLHGDFRLRVPTARPYPAGEEPFPTAEEAVEQSINIPLRPSRLVHGW